MELSQSVIYWLDDKPEEINGLIGLIEEKTKKTVEVFTKGSKFIYKIKNQPPNLSFVDLQLDDQSDEDGVQIAQTIKKMHPLLPIIAVSDHVPDYHEGITTALVRQDYPFSALWEKNTLENKSHNKEFFKQVEYFLNSEKINGYVADIEGDFTRIRLNSSKGIEYERDFETRFLNDCNLNEIGNVLELEFYKIPRNKSGSVIMNIAQMDSDRSKEEIKSNITTIMNSIDLNEIKKKFL